MKIAKDVAVSFHYTLSDPAGKVIDTSRGQQPLAYLHGHGQIVPGLERSLEGQVTGARLTLVVPAAEGYGERDPGLLLEVRRDQFPDGMLLEPGTQVMSQGGGHDEVFTIAEVRAATVVLDRNHPLAGVDLHFDVEVTAVRAASAEELAHGHVHDGRHH